MKRKTIYSVCLWLLLATQLLAANFRWIGNAQDVSQIDTITVAGAWEADDTATIICNAKSITLTCGASMDTTAEVAAGIAEMINEDNHNPNSIDADMTINAGGYEHGEFRDMVATVAGSVVTVTSAMPGVPFTITESVVTTGDGDLTHDDEVQAATGKNWFPNVGNWEGGAVPDGNDTIIFDSYADVYYGLNNTAENLSIKTYRGVSVKLGLPLTNTTHTGKPYREYRKRFFDDPLTTTTGTVTHDLGGEGSGTAQGYIYVDHGTNDPGIITIYVRDAPALANNAHAVQFVGGAADMSLFIYKGSVSVGAYPTANPSVITKLVVAYDAIQETDANVYIGSRASFTNASDTIRQSGGTIELEADCAGASNEIFIYGGELTLSQQSSCDLLRIFGGKVDYRGSAHGPIVVYDGGTFDASKCVGTDSNDEIHLFSGFTYLDPLGKIVEKLNFHGCQPSDGELVIQRDQSSTIGTITTAP